MSEEEIKIIKTASCPSLSGGSTLTYNIGCLGESQYIRVIGNTAGGLFCNDWISVSEIQELLAGCPKPTSKTLKPLYENKSTNSPGFLLACVHHERGSTPAGNGNILAEPDPPPEKKPARKKANKGSDPCST